MTQVTDFAAALAAQMNAPVKEESSRKYGSNREIVLYNNLKLPFKKENGETFESKIGRLEFDQNNKYHQKIIDGFRKDPEAMAMRVAKALIHDWFDTAAPKTEGDLAF